MLLIYLTKKYLLIGSQVEHVTGIEPVSSAWKAEMLAVTPHVHIEYFLLTVKNTQNNLTTRGIIFLIFLLYQKIFLKSKKIISFYTIYTTYDILLFYLDKDILYIVSILARVLLHLPNILPKC